MDTFEQDFETHLRLTEKNIADNEWAAVTESLGRMFAMIVYGGLRVQDRSRYNSLVRMVNHAIDSSNIEEVDETSKEIDLRFLTYNEFATKDKVTEEESKEKESSKDSIE